LDHGWNLMGFRFTNEVAHRRCGNENLQSRSPPLFIDPFKQGL
jgi:hypothetical protein